MGKIAKQDQTENDGTEHLVPRRQRRSSSLIYSCTSDINYPSTIIRDTEPRLQKLYDDHRRQIESKFEDYEELFALDYLKTSFHQLFYNWISTAEQLKK